MHNVVSGIVYCLSQKDAEDVTLELQQRHVKAGCYHANLQAHQRSAVHAQWLDGSVKVSYQNALDKYWVDSINTVYDYQLEASALCTSTNWTASTSCTSTS